jgi:hypothetical protein
MTAELIASVGMLGMFIWVCRFLLPRALRDRDSLGVSAAVLTGVLALFGWLLIGIAVRALTAQAFSSQPSALSKAGLKACTTHEVFDPRSAACPPEP